MAPSWVVPALDELEDRHAGLGLGLKLATLEQLTFERREEAFAHRIVISIADRSHGRPDAGFLAAQAMAA